MKLRAVKLMGCVLFGPLCCGCASTYLLFGPGGPFGPEKSVSPVANSQPAAVDGPAISVQQLDPLLESTAGARVIVPADMNGDGLIDFVSGSAENEPIQIHLRTPGPTPAFNTFSVAGGAPISTMYDLLVRDFDGDGHLDIAVLVNDTGFVPVTNATKRGAVVLLFAPADPSDALAWQSVTITDTFLLPGDENGLTAFDSADMDGQNGPDIVVGSNEIMNVRNIYLYRNPGGANARNGGLWARSILNTDAPPFKDLKVVDIDGDGDMDVVASFPLSKSFNLRWLINPLLESGIGAVTAGNWALRQVGEQRELTQPGDMQSPGADFIAIGDIDGDGSPDVASADVNLGLVQWFRNPGKATVQQQNFPWDVYNLGQVKTGNTINQIQLADLNGDGILDLFLTASGNAVGFQTGGDVHNWWTPYVITGTNPVANIGKCAILDVNGDTIPDIVAPMDRPGITQDQFLILYRLTR